MKLIDLAGVSCFSPGSGNAFFNGNGSGKEIGSGSCNGFINILMPQFSETGQGFGKATGHGNICENGWGGAFGFSNKSGKQYLRCDDDYLDNSIELLRFDFFEGSK